MDSHKTTEGTTVNFENSIVHAMVVVLAVILYSGCAHPRLPNPKDVGQVSIMLKGDSAMVNHMKRAYLNKKRLLRQMLTDTTSDADADRKAARLLKGNCNMITVALGTPDATTGHPAPIAEQTFDESSAKATCPPPSDVKCFANLSYKNMAEGKYNIIVTVECSGRVCTFYLAADGKTLTDNPGNAGFFVVDSNAPLNLEITLTGNEACSNE